jgi:hypothetical protein
VTDYQYNAQVDIHAQLEDLDDYFKVINDSKRLTYRNSEPTESDITILHLDFEDSFECHKDDLNDIDIESIITHELGKYFPDGYELINYNLVY